MSGRMLRWLFGFAIAAIGASTAANLLMLIISSGQSAIFYNQSVLQRIAAGILVLTPVIALIGGPLSLIVHKLTPPDVGLLRYVAFGGLVDAFTTLIFLALLAAGQVQVRPVLMIGATAGIAWAFLWWRIVRAKEFYLNA